MIQSDPSQTSRSARKSSILFLCTGNTARSQMAQALLEHQAPGRFVVTSAGLEPGTLNPLTVKALQETVPTDHLESKGVKPMLGQHFTYLVTVCDRAETNCPIFPGVTYRLAWPFDDPAAATGTEEERMTVFRRVRDEIDRKIQDWLASRPAEEPT